MQGYIWQRCEVHLTSKLLRKSRHPTSQEGLSISSSVVAGNFLNAASYFAQMATTIDTSVAHYETIVCIPGDVVVVESGILGDVKLQLAVGAVKSRDLYRDGSGPFACSPAANEKLPSPHFTSPTSKENFQQIRRLEVQSSPINLSILSPPHQTVNHLLLPAFPLKPRKHISFHSGPRRRSFSLPPCSHDLGRRSSLFRSQPPLPHHPCTYLLAPSQTAWQSAKSHGRPDSTMLSCNHLHSIAATRFCCPGNYLSHTKSGYGGTTHLTSSSVPVCICFTLHFI
ncbi:uncharacterized protein LY89DRAFT_137123 [Mollisia scopiformis]|uniref:Uncharacterized protein n=1 Tax=Mollisia scopiformis TaxID=149040 RepID=A0A194X2F9_MOLSC|nr:uncharacterized protein LY89DRAFT_137123 [Mollisia scopiformis]KUJ14376.1 hypothetical protein LY89DRAFT_137123 [Mollisia scopiformis]